MSEVGELISKIEEEVNSVIAEMWSELALDKFREKFEYRRVG